MNRAARPERFGDYELVRYLAAGGMADLYLAPIVFYVSLTPDAEAVFAVDGFADWWTKIQNLQSFKNTPPG